MHITANNTNRNVFDFVVTVLSAVPRIISIFASQNGDSSFSSLSNQLRLFRTLRLLKMVARSARLRVVISTVFEAFHSLGFILLLLLLLTYMFGIFAINVFYQYTYSLQDDLQYQHKFKDLSNAFITLFQLLTLDQWYAIQQDIQRIVSPTLVISFFIFWVWIAAFIFRNVFVGVMVAKFDEMNQKLRRYVMRARASAQALPCVHLYVQSHVHVHLCIFAIFATDLNAFDECHILPNRNVGKKDHNAFHMVTYAHIHVLYVYTNTTLCVYICMYIYVYVYVYSSMSFCGK